MPNNALYIYGVVRCGFDLNWKENGINGENVYAISEGKFSALVHDCEEKPYAPKEPNEVKELIIAHSKILNRAIEDFGGVIPSNFNTIIKNNGNLSKNNLKKWLKDEQERLERTWNKVRGKREYGLRIYYEKDKFIQEASENNRVRKIKESINGKERGLSYLLQCKVKSKIKDLVQEKIIRLKQEVCNNIKNITENTVINPSSILLDEEKDLLLSLSVLIEEEKVSGIKEILEKSKEEGLSFHLAGPFAPHSFI